MGKRTEKALDFIKKKGAGTAIIAKAEDIYYLSNFFPTSPCFLIISKKKEKHDLIVSEMEKSMAENACSDAFEIYSFSSYTSLKKIFSEILEEMRESACRIALNKESISLRLYEKMIKRRVKAKRIIDLNFSELRAVKEASEIGKIKSAVNICGKVFCKIRELKKLENKKEREIMNEISFLIGSYENCEIAFKPIVASGENSCFPHHESGERRIKKGDAIIIDFGARYKRYACDVTRTIFLDEKEKYLKIYDAVREAQKEAIKLLKPGEKVSNIDKKARKIFREHGIERYFRHSLGHGIGLEVHEFPRISREENAVLKKNMVVTVEPGIYGFNGFGVRIEDVVIVKNKPEVITKSIY